jgi:hypothetical protein
LVDCVACLVLGVISRIFYLVLRALSLLLCAFRYISRGILSTLSRIANGFLSAFGSVTSLVFRIAEEPVADLRDVVSVTTSLLGLASRVLCGVFRVISSALGTFLDSAGSVLGSTTNITLARLSSGTGDSILALAGKIGSAFSETASSALKAT